MLAITDSQGVLERFNDDKAWLEIVLTRFITGRKSRSQIAIRGIANGLHNDSVYRQLEAAADGVIDFKLEETANGVTRDVMRIRNMRNQHFIRGWQTLRIGENFEITLEK